VNLFLIQDFSVQNFFELDLVALSVGPTIGDLEELLMALELLFRGYKHM